MMTTVLISVMLTSNIIMSQSTYQRQYIYSYSCFLLPIESAKKWLELFSWRLLATLGMWNMI